jgi:four helix bundle protein
MKKKERKVEDLLVWQQAISVANVIYLHFNLLNDFGFRNQIQRAAVSISNNIAEGFYRKSDREFKRFLTIALGSMGELKSMLILAVHLKYISEALQSILTDQLNQIGKMINSLINYLGREIERSK